MKRSVSFVRKWQAAVVVACLVALVGGGAFLTQATAQPENREAVNVAKQLSLAFHTAAKDVLPSVVTITNQPAEVTKSDLKGEELNPLEGTPFEDLFREHPELRDQFRFQIPLPRRQTSLGSGVIIDPSGLILTNNHVVEGGGDITVRLHDGTEFAAEEVRTDPRTDVAILRISGAPKLTAARLGDSDKLDVGDWVLAVGNPFGQEGSVTAGIISATHRGPGIAPREEFLQTDAAINPGNSGGPLVNLDGEVVGINTAISTRTGSYAGVAFAVPINLATWVANELVEHNEVRRAYLGIQIQPVDSDLAQQLGLKDQRGTVVTAVGPDTPAAAAGLEPGDVIVKFDGRQIDDSRTLQAVVERTPIDSTVPVDVIRNGQQRHLQVTVRKQPKDYGMAELTGQPGGGPSASPERGSYNDLGIEVGSLDAEVAQQLGMEGVEGVVITSVRPGSPADREQLEPSMVITQVGRKTVKNLDDFKQAMSEVNFKKDGVLFLVRTRTGSHFVAIRPPRG